MNLQDMDVIIGNPKLIEEARRNFALQGRKNAEKVGNTAALMLDIVQTLTALECLLNSAPTPRTRRWLETRVLSVLADHTDPVKMD